MVKPILLLVDDEPDVLHALEWDMRRQFGKDFRILRAESGTQTLEALKQLAIREEPVALLLTDHRMPEMSGVDLLERARVLYPQARHFGVELLTPLEVTSLRVEGSYRFVTLADGTELGCSVLLIATGVSYRTLDIPGLEHLTGAGVYYGAAVAEALSCRDSDVFLVGGANSVGQAAMHLSRYARMVTILVRSDSLEKSMSQYLIDQIRLTSNISVQTSTFVAEAHGEDNLNSLTIVDLLTGNVRRESAAALFIFIGAVPHTEWLAPLIQRDKQGFLLTGPDLIVDGRRPQGWPLARMPFLLETNIPGIFAAGDVRHGSIKRVASSVGEGSVAIQLIHQYLDEVHSCSRQLL